MKTIPTLFLATTALTLAACSGGGDAAAGGNLLNEIAAEPEANLVADLPAETNDAAAEDNAPAGAEPAAPDTPTQARPAPTERAAPAAPPKQEPVDPHAGHDMGNMTHN